MDGQYQPDHAQGHEGFRARTRMSRRPATDYSAAMAQWVFNRRPQGNGYRGFEVERPSPSYVIDILPPPARKGNAVDSLPAKHLHSSLNKMRHPVNVVKWTPEGRRLLTGSTSGEFTLWNGTAFNFETIMQAHDSAVRAVAYSHSDDWLISAEQAGIVKYWQPNFNNVKSIQAHTDPVRDLAFAPTDTKFVTAADDGTLKIFDFAGGVEESVLTGHQWDAKCVDWHPTKGLLVSGSKDHQIKFWDPRAGRCLTTLHGHKNTVSKTLFEPQNGVLLASCARDQTARVFDIRMMRDVFLLRGHEKEISTLTWHPIHSAMLTTGGADGSMHHYLLDEQNLPEGAAPTLSPYDAPENSDAPAQTLYPAHKVQFAHDFAIWSLDWHPLGHILASGSNDRATRFWSRPRPGDSTYKDDRWHIGQSAAEAQGTWKRSGDRAAMADEEEAEDEAEGLEDQKMPSRRPLLPGLPGIGAALPSFPDGTSTGGAQPLSFHAPGDFGMPGGPSMPNLPFPMPMHQGGAPPVLPPGMDMEKLKQMFGGQLPLPPPMSHGQNGQGFPPPPLPGFPGAPPPLPGMFPPGFVPPPGFPMPPPGGLPGMPPDQQQFMQQNGGGANRRRAPLPSQQESLQEEMKRGKYTRPR
ncbi:WD40-repeat-containing domain protein [Delphinella strobiligena]|nr:WD40-repeat-containing domain protein [Delphinella strobiligena]